jgi:hypothetical protein
MSKHSQHTTIEEQQEAREKESLAQKILEKCQNSPYFSINNVVTKNKD